jgi:hypothetical protein
MVGTDAKITSPYPDFNALLPKLPRNAPSVFRKTFPAVFKRNDGVAAEADHQVPDETQPQDVGHHSDARLETRRTHGARDREDRGVRAEREDG